MYPNICFLRRTIEINCHKITSFSISPSSHHAYSHFAFSNFVFFCMRKISEEDVVVVVVVLVFYGPFDTFQVISGAVS